MRHLQRFGSLLIFVDLVGFSAGLASPNSHEHHFVRSLKIRQIGIRNYIFLHVYTQEFFILKIIFKIRKLKLEEEEMS